MLPIIDGNMKSGLALTTGGGKKKWGMSYTFHIDTSDLAQKAGAQIQQVAEKGYAEASRFIKRKYRTMRVKRTLNNMRKSLSRKIKLDLPIDFKALKSRMAHATHA